MQGRRKLFYGGGGGGGGGGGWVKMLVTMIDQGRKIKKKKTLAKTP